MLTVLLRLLVAMSTCFEPEAGDCFEADAGAKVTPSHVARLLGRSNPHITSVLGVPPVALRISHSRSSCSESCHARAVDAASSTAGCGGTGSVSS